MDRIPEQPARLEQVEFPPELSARFSPEFETYREKKLQGSREEHALLFQKGIISREEMEQSLSAQERELAGLEEAGRISRVLNNFHQWWPGGQKQALTERKEKKEGETEIITKQRSQIADVRR